MATQLNIAPEFDATGNRFRRHAPAASEARGSLSLPLLAFVAVALGFATTAAGAVAAGLFW